MGVLSRALYKTSYEAPHEALYEATHGPRFVASREALTCGSMS